MNTKKFKTRTEFIERKNVCVPNKWEMALDIGYSSVKIFSPNIVAAFPSFASRIQKELDFSIKPPKDSIMYRDLETNELWVVGEHAQNTISIKDTNSESVLYGRDRYGDPMFKVIARTGMGIASMTNEYGKPSGEYVLQTGLPENYLDDEPDLKAALKGTHRFALKVGDRDWEFFEISLHPDSIWVMPQPKGTLFSVCVNNDGTILPQNSKLLSSSTIVFDAGFGTLDLFVINSGKVLSGETFADLGMRRVFQETAAQIYENYRMNISVPAMQTFLESGIVRVADKANFGVRDVKIDEYLAKANNAVCEEAISRMVNAIGFENLVQFYKGIIVTGGTGAAWSHHIKEKFSNFTGLEIIDGNQNDNLSCIYSNVRGYYLYRHNKLARG